VRITRGLTADGRRRAERMEFGVIFMWLSKGRRSGQNGITFLSSHESSGGFFFYLGNSVFVDP
jgi:hypothetical protein